MALKPTPTTEPAPLLTLEEQEALAEADSWRAMSMSLQKRTSTHSPPKRPVTLSNNMMETDSMFTTPIETPARKAALDALAQAQRGVWGNGVLLAVRPLNTAVGY